MKKDLLHEGKKSRLILSLVSGVEFTKGAKALMALICGPKPPLLRWGKKCRFVLSLFGIWRARKALGIICSAPLLFVTLVPSPPGGSVGSQSAVQFFLSLALRAEFTIRVNVVIDFDS